MKIREQLEADKEKDISEDIKSLLSTEEGMRKVIQVLIEKIEEMEK